MLKPSESRKDVSPFPVSARCAHSSVLTAVFQTRGVCSGLTNSIVYHPFWWGHKNMHIYAQGPLCDYSGEQIELHYGIKLLFTSTPPAKTLFDMTNRLIAAIYRHQSLAVLPLKDSLYYRLSKWSKGFRSVLAQFNPDCLATCFWPPVWQMSKICLYASSTYIPILENNMTRCKVIIRI